MIKLMIIDDEAEILKNLRQCIDWTTWGIELAAVATNAAEAREKTLAVHPDIIISDIYMPGKDGLVFCAEIKAILPKIKIIILSGYNESGYLHRALSLGVNEYLLKPAGIDVIVSSVLKLKKEIIEERNKDKEDYIKETLIIENLLTMRLQFIEHIISQPRDGCENLSQKAKMLGIPLEGPYYQVILLRKYPEKSDDCKSDIQLDMDFWRFTQKLENIRLKIPRSFFCEIETFDYFWLLNINDAESARRQAETLIALLEQTFHKGSVAMAVGTPACGLSEIPQSYANASAALCKSAWDEDCNVFYYQTPAVAPANIEQALGKLDKRIIDALVSKQSALCMEMITKAFMLCREANYPLTPLRMICKHIMLVISPSPEDGGGPAPFPVKSYHIDEIYAGNELEKWITERVQLYFDNRSLNSCLPIVNKAVRYIHTHYQNDITLQQLAKELFITPNYLGRLFHQETGCKMSDYLNRFRIERAKELLKDPNFKTSEVAEAVGFTSYKYFLVCFAKYANCNLREFRSASQQTDG